MLLERLCVLHLVCLLCVRTPLVFIQLQRDIFMKMLTRKVSYKYVTFPRTMCYAMRNTSRKP